MKTTKLLAFLCVLMWLTISCEQENSYNPNNPTNNESVTVTKNAITGIWKINNLEYKSSSSSWYGEMTDLYISFENDGTYNFYFYQPLGLCAWRFYGYWSVINGVLQMEGKKLLLLFDDGDYINKDWTLPNMIISCQLSQSKLILDGYDQTIIYAEKVYSLPSKYNTLKSYNPNEGSGGGGGSSQGVTDLYLYDYTEWPTKIKVIYKYKSDVNVTSAKIYYGEYSASSSVSATVSSTTITATISGLKKNTVYYVKASATTSKGTVYSSESRISTAIE